MDSKQGMSAYKKYFCCIKNNTQENLIERNLKDLHLCAIIAFHNIKATGKVYSNRQNILIILYNKSYCLYFP